MDFPGTIERGKALAILDELAASEENKGTLIRKGGPRLISLSRLLQPSNHNYDYKI
jgi:hypothetical protein